LQHHSLLYTLLESAILATVSLCFVDFAITICDACVHPSVLYCPLEKSLAPDRPKRRYEFGAPRKNFYKKGFGF